MDRSHDPVSRDDMKRELLVQEAERTTDDYSFTWEGELEEVIELGDVRVRRFPDHHHRSDGWIVHNRFSEEGVKERLRQVMDSISADSLDFHWFVGPSSPPGLGNALEQEGYL